MPAPPAATLEAPGSQGWAGGPSGWGEGTGGCGGPWTAGGAHIGVLVVEVLILVLQDVVWVPDLLPDVHGLGRTLGQSVPAPPRGSWLCPLLHCPVGKGLTDAALRAGCGEV